MKVGKSFKSLCYEMGMRDDHLFPSCCLHDICDVPGVDELNGLKCENIRHQINRERVVLPELLIVQQNGDQPVSKLHTRSQLSTRYIRLPHTSPDERYSVKTELIAMGVISAHL